MQASIAALSAGRTKFSYTLEAVGEEPARISAAVVAGGKAVMVDRG